MFKTLLTSLIVFLLTVTTLFVPTKAAGAPSVILNGQAVTFSDVSPQIIQDRAYIPFNALLQTFGANVTWDGVNRVATAQKEGITVRIPIDQKVLDVNGHPLTMDVPSVILNDRTLVPLRYVAQALGASVKWTQNSDGGLIEITQSIDDEINQLVSGFSGDQKLTNEQKTIVMEWLKAQNVKLPDDILAPADASNIGADDFETAIEQHMSNRDSSFSLTFKGDNFDIIDQGIQNVLKQDDYLHYMFSKYSWKAKSDGENVTVNMEIVYLETNQQSAYVDQKVREILNEIIQPGMNDLQKEKAIHDYIVSHVAYDQSLVEHSPYAALAKGTTVCQGYALLTYKMLNEVGIPVRIVEGNAGGILHTWNLVQIGGRWYHLDTTWDDPIPDVEGRILYNYFNLTDDQISKDHSWKNDNNYPEANTVFTGF